MYGRPSTATGKTLGTKSEVELIPEKYGGVPTYGRVKVVTAIS
jgi:hypothetical protein